VNAKGRRRAELLLALGVVALAGVVAWQTAAVPSSPAYAQVGPKVFPAGVAVGLLVLGLALGWQALTGRRNGDDDAEDTVPVDWHALAWLGAGLVLNVALIGVIGFVLSSTILFVCVARAFGSRRPARDAAIAVLFSLVTYIGFDRVLGISIGAGVFEELF
jgi:putative tricarboxylic transport membrane protein